MGRKRRGRREESRTEDRSEEEKIEEMRLERDRWKGTGRREQRIEEYSIRYIIIVYMYNI